MKPFRRYFQVRLITLLFAVAFFYIFLSWFTNKAHQQEQIIRAIKEMGGSVSYDYQFDENDRFSYEREPGVPQWLIDLFTIDAFYNVRGVSSGHNQKEDDAFFLHLIQLPHLEVLGLGSELTDTRISNLHRLPRLRILFLPNTYISDEELGHLSELHELERLDLTGTKITGTGFHHLRKMESLRVLDLKSSLVGNLGLQHLQGHPNLRELDLSYSRVDDDGLVHLKHLPKLESVVICRMNVSDVGLKYLEDCTNLRHVSIKECTHVTKQGIKALGRALPYCKIEHESNEGSY